MYKFAVIQSKKKNASIFIHQNPFFYPEIFDAHEKIWPTFFEPFKLIFVHRDPYDQFADIVDNKQHIITFEHRFYTGTYHLHSADRYFEICKNIYLARLRMAKEYSPDQLIIFSFEDFLKNHQNVSGQLKDFLGIHSERDPDNKEFVLEQSLKNIGNGRNNTEALALLDGKPYIMEELYDLHSQLERLPHTIYIL